MSLQKRVYSLVLILALSTTIAGCAIDGECASGACGKDAAITANVRSRLDNHSELGAPNSIEVQTRAGVVYLNGLVNNGLERGIAESVATQTPGVLKVLNSIAVEK